MRALVRRETADTIELKNGVDIAISTASYRAIRGRSYLAVIMDEVAVWHDENSSTNPDKEIFRSLRPGMATLPQSLLIGITSPFKRSGLTYERWSKYFGKDDPRVLVVHAPSTTFNPVLDEAEIAAAMADDPLAARSDFYAEWRDDLASYIPRDLIESSVDRDIIVRPYERGHRYFAFLDAAEGLSASGDSFAAAIAHNERHGDRDVLVLDWIQEWRPPYNPAQVVRAIAGVLDEYRLGVITGDHHAAGFVINELLKCGKRLVDCELNKSDLYMELLPRFSASCVRLLDSDRLVGQFCALERKSISGGTTKVDHPRGSHDDLCNAVSGALWCAGSKRRMIISESFKAWAAIPQVINTLEPGVSRWQMIHAAAAKRREPKTIATISTADRPTGATFLCWSQRNGSERRTN